MGAIIYTTNVQQWFDSGPVKSKWLLCDGSAFLQADYPDLYAFLGGNVTPNLNGQFVRCINNSGARMPLST